MHCSENIDDNYIAKKKVQIIRSECVKLSKNYIGNIEARLSSGRSHTNAKCDWDEGPQQRKRDLMKKFTRKEAEEDDLNVYLAEDSDEESQSEALKAKRLDILF